VVVRCTSLMCPLPRRFIRLNPPSNIGPAT
jgi:hypothetical protein